MTSFPRVLRRPLIALGVGASILSLSLAAQQRPPADERPLTFEEYEPKPTLVVPQPVDRFNERWMELTQLPDRRLPPDQYPGFEDIMAERDRLFARHPKTRFIAAHMGWHANERRSTTRTPCALFQGSPAAVPSRLTHEQRPATRISSTRALVAAIG